MIDSYKQEWFGNLKKSPVLYMYKHVKTSFEYDCYLDDAVGRPTSSCHLDIPKNDNGQIQK